MPELPEVETLRRTLEPHLLGAAVIAVSLRRRGVCTFDPPRSAAHRPDALLRGGVVLALDRRGKQLAIIADDGRALCVHLGMSGQLRFEPDPPPRPPPHTHLLWTIAREGRITGRLRFTDPRRFGGVWAFDSPEALRRSRWETLGHDALAADEAALFAGLTGSRRAIKACLLDQTLLAGVGNIYADEALFRARISPHRPGGTLDAGACAALARAVREVLGEAIAAGGATLRDYVDADGQSGSSQDRFQAYGRAGQSCRCCGTPLSSARLSQRATVWCSTCQS